jgi:hypothetical protein
MAITRSKIEANLLRIRRDVAEACARAERSPSGVSIVAVTKSVDVETALNLLDLGLCDLGESRVQQLVERAGELSARLARRRNSTPVPVRWHMVGHLQRNKVSPVMEVADVIHSVDSLRLAEDINARGEQAGRRVNVLMQVNCSKEPQKFGVTVGAAPHLAELLCTLGNLRLIGLMTMAERTRDPETARPTFALLRELFDDIRKEKVGGADFQHLSMGMSQDYTVAVEEGATILRIGTALFE